MELILQVNHHELIAELVDNSSTKALIELLKISPQIINMKDYLHFEKVGELNVALPRNDESFTTEAGDLILYLGNKFVIYYDTNHYRFMRLGKIKNVIQKELIEILGPSDVVVKISLKG